MHSLLLLYAEPDGKQGKEDKPAPEANFALSGKLAAESNTVKGVVLVHQEPPEARKPSQMWRLYGFKNGELSSSSSSSSSSPPPLTPLILHLVLVLVFVLLSFVFFFIILFLFSFSFFFFLFFISFFSSSLLSFLFFFFLVSRCAL